MGIMPFSKKKTKKESLRDLLPEDLKICSLCMKRPTKKLVYNQKTGDIAHSLCIECWNGGDITIWAKDHKTQTEEQRNKLLKHLKSLDKKGFSFNTKQWLQ